MTTLTHVRNPYSGQSTLLTQDEYKLYIEIKTAEMDEHYDVIMGSNLIAERYDQTHGMGSSRDWEVVRKGLDWFRKYFAKEYMVLLA